MKIGIISDIHCDIGALKQALEHMGTVDHLFCAGDLVLQYRFSNEVIDLMRQMRIPTISGNHDLSVLSSAGAALRASGSASAENLDYLSQLPQHISCKIDGKHIVVMHTSKLDPSNHLPEYEPSDANVNIDQQADVLIVGHTHWPVISQVGKIL
ncbi:metallophosphatase family protein, partial [Dehalococcoidia bacterium]|nr:metallophosphatase family protein [Dehalococcoidia bacterium]